MNKQDKNNQQIEQATQLQTTKTNTNLPDTTPILSRRKKRRISSGW